jgi:hypothetical protein
MVCLRPVSGGLGLGFIFRPSDLDPAARFKSLIESVWIDLERLDLIRSNDPQLLSDRNGIIESGAAAWQPVVKPDLFFVFKFQKTC